MLLLGDCIEQMKTLPDNSVDAVVTDPPYGLSFMGKKWDYDVPSVDIWKEVLRVLKPGGHLLSFGGTRTYHRMVVNIEDAGFEIRDQIQWIYGSGFPKSHNGTHGGTALKPANEPIVLARKPLEKGLTVAKNFEKWGTGGLNIDGSRIGVSINDPNHRKPSVPFTGRVFDIADGKSNGRPIENLNPQGRWPANLILDETAAEMLDEQSGQLLGRGSNNIKTEVDSPTGFLAGAKFKAAPVGENKGGGASRFFYVAKASKRDRNSEGVVKNTHPTCKPTKLMEYLCRLITPIGGTILDPFMGSGSTGVAATRLGFNFIGCEMDEEYLEIAQKRIAHASKTL